MDINELVLTDEALHLVDHGTWVGDLTGAPGVELLVCGIQSQEAQKALEQKQEAQRLKNRGKPLTVNQLDRTMRETLHEVVLKDWKGLKKDGEPIPYSKEFAKEWIMSRNGRRFTDLVLRAAQTLDEQTNEFVEEVSKN